MLDYQCTLPLTGGCNFRDLGGYIGANQRKVSKGLLFRSGVLSYLTPEDQQNIERLGIKVVCDLRRADEREREPTRLPSSIDIVAWDKEPHLEKEGELAWSELTNASEAIAQMTCFYRRLPTWIELRLRGVLEHLVADRTPLLFHCAAGKDRTGFIAAILLHILGVDRETILLDYEYTNKAVDLGAFVLKHHNAQMGVANEEHPLTTMDPGLRQALLSADRSYLAAALDQIDYDYGSIDLYLASTYGIDAEAKAHIQSRHLDPA